MIAELCWKNLWRTPRRTWGLIAALAAALAALLLLVAWIGVADGGRLPLLSVVFAAFAGVGAFVAAVMAGRIVEANAAGRAPEIVVLRAFGFSRARIATLLAGEMAMLVLCADVLALAAVWAGLAGWRSRAFAGEFVRHDMRARLLVGVAFAWIVAAAALAAWQRLRGTACIAAETPAPAPEPEPLTSAPSTPSPESA